MKLPVSVCLNIFLFSYLLNCILLFLVWFQCFIASLIFLAFIIIINGFSIHFLMNDYSELLDLKDLKNA